MDTSDVNSLIGQAYRFIVHKDYLYIPDYTTAPKIFTMKGKFVKTLISGRGQGEIGGRVNDIYIDRENHLFEVSEFSKISKYTLSGDFVSDEKQSEDCSDVCKLGDYVISYDGISSRDSCFFKIMNRRTGERLMSLFPKNNKDGVGYGWGIMANGVFMRSNENIYFNIPFTDEIYKIEKGDSIPRRFAKIKNVLMYDKCPEFELWALSRYAQSEKRNIYICNLSVSEDENLISFKVNESITEDKNVEHRVIYDQSKHKIFNYPVQMIDIVFSDGVYDYGIAFPEMIDAQRDKFIESKEPLMKELCDFIDRNGMDTNPYVVKIKLFKK